MPQTFYTANFETKALFESFHYHQQNKTIGLSCEQLFIFLMARR